MGKIRFTLRPTTNSVRSTSCRRAPSRASLRNWAFGRGTTRSWAASTTRRATAEVTTTVMIGGIWDLLYSWMVNIRRIHSEFIFRDAILFSDTSASFASRHTSARSSVRPTSSFSYIGTAVSPWCPLRSSSTQGWVISFYQLDWYMYILIGEFL